jgi:eukaryotic-like serine/threonine-protein kinase
MAEPGPADQVLGGRYRLRSRLAAGGMGAVWAAEDLLLGREVAVKLLGEALATDRLAALRLRREARAAGRLVHPGIARVLDLGEDGGRPYLVMELLRGESLAARLARLGPLAPAEAVRVVAAAADALEAAHRAGIVHRDVKPGNVFVTSGGDVKLLDFGIASAAGDTAVTGGVLLGTAAYLAPERVLGHHATPAADVYALGVLLYELLAGRPPFAGDIGTALAMAHVHAHPAPLRSVAPRVPPALAAACEHALAKDPAARPPSAAALAALLRAAVPTDRPPPHPGPATAGSPTAVLPPASALGATTPVHRPAPALDAGTRAHAPAAGTGDPTPVPSPAPTAGATAPVHRPAAIRGVRRTRGAAATARRGTRVTAVLLLAALLAAVPSLGLLRLGGREPARPGGQAPADGQTRANQQGSDGGQTSADGQAPSAGQVSQGGGLGVAPPGRQETPAVADPPGNDPGDGNGGGGGEGSGDDGGGGGSSGPG